MAGSLICIKHPKYDGIEAPDLSCKACCAKYIAQVTASQALAKKAQKAYGISSNGPHVQTNPFLRNP